MLYHVFLESGEDTDADWAILDIPAFLASLRMSDLVTPARAGLSDLLRRDPERPQPE